MPRRKWTEKETNLLIELFPKERINKIAEKLGRPISSIEQKAGRIRKSRGTLLRSRYWWTNEEKDTLRLLWKSHTVMEIANILNRPRKSVQHKAMELGLIKYRKWDEKRIKTLRNLWNSEKSIADIASKMGISKALVSRMASKLQLKRKFSYPRHLKGFDGEKAAEKLFRQQGWRIVERGISRGRPHAPAFDFVVETNEGKRYAINVKHGRNMAVSMRNIERLMRQQSPCAFLFITDNNKAFFMPITQLQQ